MLHKGKKLPDLLPPVIEADVGVTLRVTVAHRLPLTRHFHRPAAAWQTQTHSELDTGDTGVQQPVAPSG